MLARHPFRPAPTTTRPPLTDAQRVTVWRLIALMLASALTGALMMEAVEVLVQAVLL